MINEYSERRIYYLVGPPGVGKSLIRDKIGGDFVLEEWLSPPPIEMYTRSNDLDKASSEKVDLWIKEQLSRKVAELEKIKGGIVIVDRSPLDVIAFPTKEETMLERALKFYDIYYSADREGKIAPPNGVIIHLRVDRQTLLERRIEKNQKEKRTHPVLLETVANDVSMDEIVFGQEVLGIFQVNTNNISLARLAERLENLVHDAKYTPLDLQGYMLDLIERLRFVERK